MTYGQAKTALFDMIGSEYHVIAAWEYNGSYFFTVGEQDETSSDFDLPSWIVGKDTRLPVPVAANENNKQFEKAIQYGKQVA